VILVVASASFLASVATGALLPQNDDWSFMRSAFDLHRTGHLRLQGWGQMFLVGHLATAQPFLTVFGDHVASLKLYGVTAAALWMWCAFAVARRCVGPARAVAVPVVLALWPGLPLLASSFMTDLPAAAMSLLTVLVGARAVDEQSRPRFLLAVAAGIVAFTIREQAVAGLGAVLVGALVHAGTGPRWRQFRRFAVTATVSAAVACVVLEQLRHQLGHPDIPPFGFRLHAAGTWRSGLRVPYTLGLVLSPLSGWSLWRAWSRRSSDRPVRGAPPRVQSRRSGPGRGRVCGWLLGGCGMAALAAGNHLAHLPRVLLSNYTTAMGGFRVATVGYAPSSVEPWLWDIAQVLGAVAGIVLLGEIGARAPRTPRTAVAKARAADPAGTMLAAYTGFLACFGLVLCLAGQFQVDRYHVPMLPGLAVLLLTPVGAARAPATSSAAGGGGVTLRPAHLLYGVVAAALVAILLTLSVTNTLLTDRRDHAVWEAARRLTHAGVPATAINAGLDWNGMHATARLDRDHSSSHGYRGQQWMYLFPAATDCYVVAASELHRDFLLELPVAPDVARHGVHVYRNIRCRAPGG
jgi:hypothetical protein